MTLHEVRGHGPLREQLARAHLRGGFPSALLVHGRPGVGKQRLGLWIARLLVCDAPDASGPCGSCHPCRLALRLEHPDIHWHPPLARPKGASTPEKLADALEEARYAELAEWRARPLRPIVTGESRAHYLAAARTLRRKAHARPAMGDRQIFLIGDAETLVPQESSPEAANALLKLLEEPPGGTRFILTSSEPGRLLATIRSRCLPLHLPPLPLTEVEDFLRDVAGADEKAAARAAALSHGSIGRALGFLPEDGDPGSLEELRREAFEIVRAGRTGRSFEVALGYAPAGARGLLDLFGFVEEWLRDVAATAAGAGESVVNGDHRSELEELARDVDPVRVHRAMEAVDDAREKARGNVNPQLLVTALASRVSDALRQEGTARGATR